jgi:hypothetical protein
MNCYSGKEIPTEGGKFEIKDDGLPYMVVRSFREGYPLRPKQTLKFGSL